MHFLPPTELFGRLVSLPLNRRGIELLTCALLSDGDGLAMEQADSFVRNPPLVLFLAARLVAAREGNWQDRLGELTIGNLLATCFASNVASMLNGPFAQAEVTESATGTMHGLATEAWNRIQQRLPAPGTTLVDSNSRSALDDLSITKALLCDAKKWCELGIDSGGAPDDGSEEQSDGLRGFREWIDSIGNDEAVGALNDNREASGVDELLHSPWRDLDSVNWLPTLVGRSLRLRQLESEFDRQLHASKMAAMKELAYGASHEINNPLANISSRAQTLLRDEKDPDRQETLAAINRQAFRGHEMIADMMLFAHPPKIQAEKVHVHEMVKQVLEEITPWADGLGTKITTSDVDSQLNLMVDRTQMTVAIKALVRNSVEALRGGGNIRIAASGDSDRNQASVSVHDDGPGISAEIRPHLFEPFYSGREAGRGLGFGLSKVWRIVTEHGGNVLVDSVPDQDGTCFTLRLPWHGG